MSSLTTLARPYAKAAFELAQAGNDLAGWDNMLILAGAIAAEKSVAGLLERPHVGATRVVKLLADIGGEHFNQKFRDFLSVLGASNRLSLLSEITALYRRLRDKAEKRLRVRVVSAVPLEEDQSCRMRDALAKRFESEIELKSEIDPSVLGGAVIYAGGQVIDGSLLGRLRKLEQILSH
ncbi:MAG: F0F1 ATP synthase subunit delta [Xanthomonadales bacterium]